MSINVKRIYDAPARGDGHRVLVDRVWPRGIRKDDAELEEWLKEAAPSTALRKWFAHDPAKWTEFKRRYFQELAADTEVHEALADLRRRARRGPVTLLFGSRETRHNNAVALKEYLEQTPES